MSDKTNNELLVEVQANLVAPKGQYNSFAKYHFRSAEDILTAVKPLLAERGLSLLLWDNIEEHGGRVYVKATAELSGDEGAFATVTAYAREPENRKGSDESQITGAASSYARKYALNGLFLIDDTKDADATNTHGKEPKKEAPAKKKPTIKALLECIDGAKDEKGLLDIDEAASKYEWKPAELKKIAAAHQERHNQLKAGL